MHARSMPVGQRTGSQLLNTSVLRMEDRPDGSAPVPHAGQGCRQGRVPAPQQARRPGAGAKPSQHVLWSACDPLTPLQAYGVRVAAARPLGILRDRAELLPDQPLDRVERAAGICGGLAAKRVRLSACRGLSRS